MSEEFPTNEYTLQVHCQPYTKRPQKVVLYNNFTRKHQILDESEYSVEDGKVVLKKDIGVYISVDNPTQELGN